jgi:hypothetical protein
LCKNWGAGLFFYEAGKKNDDFLKNLGEIKPKRGPEQITDQKTRFFKYTYPLMPQV